MRIVDKKPMKRGHKNKENYNERASPDQKYKMQDKNKVDSRGKEPDAHSNSPNGSTLPMGAIPPATKAVLTSGTVLTIILVILLSPVGI